MAQRPDDEEDAHAAVRAESHDEALGCGDVLPSPAGAEERLWSGDQFRLQSGHHGLVAGRQDTVSAGTKLYGRMCMAWRQSNASKSGVISLIRPSSW